MVAKYSLTINYWFDLICFLLNSSNTTSHTCPFRSLTINTDILSSLADIFPTSSRLLGFLCSMVRLPLNDSTKKVSSASTIPETFLVCISVGAFRKRCHHLNAVVRSIFTRCAAFLRGKLSNIHCR
jgi:hypothetical protein